MPPIALPRRSALLLPFALAACGGEQSAPEAFPPLRFNDLPPIELTVASIGIEQRFVPSGLPPDVSAEDPEPPIEALRSMARDRLMAFGTQNRAVFAVLNATLTKQGSVIIGILDVSLTIVDTAGNQLGYAEAQVHSEHTGPVGNLRTTLYEFTKAMMANMNVEFEYQVRHNLSNFLTSPAVPDAPVQQTPLDQPGAAADPGQGGAVPSGPTGGAAPTGVPLPATGDASPGSALPDSGLRAN